MGTVSAWLSLPYVGSVIGIIGVAIAIITYILSRPKYKISLHKVTNDLIGLSDSLLPNQVEVLYEGETVDKLASSTFIIWNSGNKVITKSALATINPLRIEVEDNVRILRYEIEKLSNPTCNIAISLDPSKKHLTLDFDFLEKNDGVRIKILHTGEDEEIKLVGKVIGVKTPSAATTKKQSKIQTASLAGQLISNIPKPIIYTSIFLGFAALFVATFIWPDELIRFNELTSGSTI